VLCNVCSVCVSLPIRLPSYGGCSTCILTTHPAQNTLLTLSTYDQASRGVSLDYKVWLEFSVGVYSSTGQIYNVLSKYTSRWESLVIYLPSSANDYLPQSADAPLLRYLSISNGFSRVPILSAPRLTTLVIYDLRHEPLTMPTIPWHQLTVLRISQMTSLFIVLNLIKCCHQLEELTLPDVYNSESVWTEAPRIKHTALRKLELSRIIDYGELLDTLSLPALKDLSLAWNVDLEDQEPTSALYDLFNQSNCELESLFLSNAWFDSDEIQRCLEHNSCKTLKFLHLRNDVGGVTVGDKLFARLTCYEGQTEGPLCPGLVDLALDSCYYTVSPGLIGRMALSRCVGRAECEGLKSLTLIAYLPLSEEDYELTKQARSNGCRISHRVTL